jgi:hypothetical protein
MKRLYAVFLLVVAAYFLIAPAGTARSQAEIATKPIPVDEATGGHEPQAVH